MTVRFTPRAQSDLLSDEQEPFLTLLEVLESVVRMNKIVPQPPCVRTSNKSQSPQSKSSLG